MFYFRIVENMFWYKVLLQKTHLSKKLILSDSNDSESSSDEMSASDSENSDGASSTSDNLPLSSFVEHAANSKGKYLLLKIPEIE